MRLPDGDHDHHGRQLIVLRILAAIGYTFHTIAAPRRPRPGRRRRHADRRALGSQQVQRQPQASATTEGSRLMPDLSTRRQPAARRHHPGADEHRAAAAADCRRRRHRRRRRRCRCRRCRRQMPPAPARRRCPSRARRCRCRYRRPACRPPWTPLPPPPPTACRSPPQACRWPAGMPPGAAAACRRRACRRHRIGETMSKPDPPTPPDPHATAAAQTGTNVSTAVANAYLQQRQPEHAGRLADLQPVPATTPGPTRRPGRPTTSRPSRRRRRCRRPGRQLKNTQDATKQQPGQHGQLQQTSRVGSLLATAVRTRPAAPQAGDARASPTSRRR